MKILIASRAVAPLHGQGGLERAVADLCTGLTARGHAVTLVTATPHAGAHGGDPPEVETLRTVPWPSLPAMRYGSALDRAIAYPRFVRAVARDIAAANATYDAAIGMGALAAACIAARRAGRIRQMVLNPQGLEEFFGHPAKRLVLRPQQALVRHAARHADAVIATDTVFVPTVLRTLRVPGARVVVITNGIDVDRLDRWDIAPHARADRAPLTLISVGRIVPSKGFDLLATALGRCRDRLPHGWTWLHAGDGPARPALETAVARAGIAAHVRLLGACSDADLHRALASATVFVHPTRYEGSSLVTLEAMAHRLPVIASAAGGIPDKVVEGETGWLVPPGDVDRLAAAIGAAAALPRATLAAMGAAGRARVEAHFSLAHTLDLTEALLHGGIS